MQRVEDPSLPQTTDFESPGGGVEGQVIGGKYQLVRLLGQGGMGAVYEGRNLSTLKRCAVKLLLTPELSSNQGMVKRFFREARASSIIESDYIVQIFDSGTDPQSGFPYMVMEMLQGEDLEETIKRLGALHPMVATKLILQATMGLAKAHEQGIVHRDIKPANLYLTQRESGDRILKLLDFGIAKVKMENFAETSQGLTRTGNMLGTPLYMSPEQASARSDIDARSDVWSLGVVLFELLSGAIPYESANSLGELMVAIITADLPLLQDRAPWVPPELAEVTHRAMSRDVNMRFKNAGEFRDALAALVPDGPRITGDLLIPVADQERGLVAPRLILASDGMLKATTRTGLSLTSAGSSKSKRSVLAPVLAVGAVGTLVLTGGAAAWKLTRPVTAPTVEPLSASPAVIMVSASAAPAMVEVKSFDLVIEGADGMNSVEARVDDQKVDINDGKLEISGSPGATRTVWIRYDGEEATQVVAITQRGLLPPRMKLVAPKARSTRRGVRPSRTTKSPPTKPKPKPKSEPTGKPQIATGVDEFGG